MLLHAVNPQFIQPQNIDAFNFYYQRLWSLLNFLLISQTRFGLSCNLLSVWWAGWWEAAVLQGCQLSHFVARFIHLSSPLGDFLPFSKCDRLVIYTYISIWLLNFFWTQQTKFSKCSRVWILVPLDRLFSLKIYGTRFSPN